MRRRQLIAMEARLDEVAHLVDKVDRSVERIEIVTVVREPNTTISADAYDGLRKQVVAAVSERNAHLHQLAQFDSALRNGATADELTNLVREWMAQSSVVVVDDPSVPGAFEVVGPEDAPDIRVRRPAYADGNTGRIIKAGIVERVVAAAVPAASDEPTEAGPLDAEASSSDQAPDSEKAAGDTPSADPTDSPGEAP